MAYFVQIIRENSQAFLNNLKKTESDIRSKTKRLLREEEGCLLYLETSDLEITRVLLAQILTDFKKNTIWYKKKNLKEILYTDFSSFTTMTSEQNEDFMNNFPKLLVCILDNEEELRNREQSLILGSWLNNILYNDKKIILIVKNPKQLKKIFMPYYVLVNILYLKLDKLWKENEITLNEAICKIRYNLVNIPSTSASALNEATNVNLKKEESSGKTSSLGKAATKANLKNILQSLGVTELDAVVDEEGHTQLHWAAWFGKKKIVELLLDHGAKNDVRNNYGETALHMASQRGHRAIVQMLLKRGFNVNVSDNMNEFTPLHHACAYNNDDANLIEILLRFGAKMESKEKYGQTALHWASHLGRKAVVNLLVKNGANINAQDNYYRDTPLHRATLTNQREIVLLLVQRGALLNIRNKQHQNALDIAKYNNWIGIMQILENPEKFMSRQRN